jgi:transcription elongation factor GreA
LSSVLQEGGDEVVDSVPELALGEAATRFLVSLPPEGREASQQAVNKFVRWCGGEKTFAELTAAGVASYAERLSLSDTDYAKKLELIRGFLTYAKKQGWSKRSLAGHLKTKKGKTAAKPLSPRRAAEAVSLTQQGYAELEAELADLKTKRLAAIDEVRRAAADKDFRENAPLDAARERRGQLEGRIREVEETLKSAKVIDQEARTVATLGVGNGVVLRDLTSGEELSYRLVNPNEVDPIQGKVSIVSPLGKALIGRRHGETVEVTAPAGKIRYEIKEIQL